MSWAILNVQSFYGFTVSAEHEFIVERKEEEGKNIQIFYVRVLLSLGGGKNMGKIKFFYLNS